jgi:hypothetical protein
MRFLHSINTPEQALAADGVFQYDLAVNPLSVVLLCIRPLNANAGAATFAQYLSICDAMDSIMISFRGESIFRMSGRDAAALAFFRSGIVPMQANHLDTDNDRRCVVLPLLLGRFAYDPSSCFPASRRGELVLEIDVDVVDTGYDDMRVSIETIEILDAKPKEYHRSVTHTQTFAATGDNDVDMPPGNPYRGLLCFGTTGFSTTTPVPSLGRLSTRLDNQEVGYAATDFEVAHMLPTLWGRTPPGMDGHIHRVDATSGSTTAQTDADGPSRVGQGGWENYCYLDFDPMKDDKFTLSTRGASRFSVRAAAETADLVRVIGVEQIKT